MVENESEGKNLLLTEYIGLHKKTVAFFQRDSPNLTISGVG